MSYFIYNGRSSEEFGLRIEKKNVFSAPGFDSAFTSVPGRSGDLIVSNNRFENIMVTYTVFLKRNAVSALSEALRAVKGWLYTEPERYHELSDSYDTGYLRYGVIYRSLDIEEQLNKVGAFTVTFNCKPFKYSLAGQVEQELRSGERIVNPEAFPSNPLITLLGAENITFTLQNGSYNRTWNFSGLSEGVVCDSEQMNFYYGTQLLNDKAIGSGFPQLPPGETVLTVTGADAVTVKPRWCCL